MFYIVVDVATDAIRYAGIREVLAAEALAPGCTYGKAESEGKALRMALERAANGRWAYGQLGIGPRQSGMLIRRNYGQASDRNDRRSVWVTPRPRQRRQ